MSDSSQTLQPTALDMHWVRGEGAAHSTTTNTVKHAQPISTMANLSHPRCHSWPLEATCSDPSRKLLESFPPEVKAAIFLDAMIPCLQSLIHQSSIYTFVPIRRVFAVGKAIATTCRSWRSFYYETVLCFRSNRHGAFIGVTLDELVALRQWLPDVAVVGCLLFLECDPNALLFHSSPEEHRVLRILIRDPVALAAIQVVEWGDHSTNRSASTTVPELNIESFRRIQQLLTEQAHGDHAQVRRLMMEEMTSLSLVLMSNIMSFLAAFPSLKIAEIPTWMLRTLLGFPYDRSHPLSSHLVQSLNLQSVSAQEFAKQCGLVFAHLDGISIVGYPFIIGGLIHNFRQPNPNYKNLILGELEFQSMFRTLHKRLHSPSTYFSHMKAIGWRSNHREELGHFGKILEAIMFFEPRGGLTELCISNKIADSVLNETYPPPLYSFNPVLGKYPPYTDSPR
ncbi:hypothetical protein CC2G_005167 [Coprinopsis cinerea AmutBmut pab1-1]|nr:hypothetical protein CC2G_005167 [Coprinopsis cinerea AmutBmut pab1-1]